MTGPAVAARTVHFLEDRGRRAQAQSRAAEFFGDQHRQEAGLGQGADEFGRIGAVAILGLPVRTWKVGAKPPNSFADFRKSLLIRHRQGFRVDRMVAVHSETSARPRSSICAGLRIPAKVEAERQKFGIAAPIMHAAELTPDNA